MKHIDIALVSLHSPLLCGIYEDNILVESMQSDELLLVGLPHIFESLLPTQKQDSHYKDTRIRAIYYASGPGSFSALKLTHIFLHTLQYLYDIKLFATSSFYFTHSAYIKAFGTSYFHRDAENNIILLQNVKDLINTQDSKEGAFFLPHILDKSAFSLPAQPLYILPPV